MTLSNLWEWVVIDRYTQQMAVPSEFGHGTIMKYKAGHDGETYRASVMHGNSVADSHVDTLADAFAFVAHPFRALESGDYWNGSEIMRGVR